MDKAGNFQNWLGNVRFAPRAYHQPADEAAVVELVRQARRQGLRLRVIGAGHSWSAVCETDGYLVNLDRLCRVLRVDKARNLVTVQAGIRIRALCAQLHKYGLALTNLGSIQEQSIAGAIATGTHGSGRQFGGLWTQVVGMRLVNGRAEIVDIEEERDPELLAAARVSLGALGVITQVTLRVTPAFNLREERTPMRFAKAMSMFGERLGEADHIKLWWLPHTDRVQVYRQHRTQELARGNASLLNEDSFVSLQIFGALLAAGAAMPSLIPTIQRFLCQVQFTRRSRVGPSFEVFSLGMPPLHHESEYAVPLAQAGEAAQALRELIAQRDHRVHFIIEFRFVKADSAWLSPAYERDVCFIGAYDANRRGWPRFLHDFEELMRRYSARPHWGKEFSLDAAALAALYPRWGDFQRLQKELDPDGVFLNKLLQRMFVG